MLFHVIHPAAGERRQAGFDVALMRQAAQAGPVACLWEADQSLVVPRTYRRHPPFAQACGQFARRGWPVAVRLSGGGLVPQGPGIVNLSMAYAAKGVPLDHSDAAYQSICTVIARALREFGIMTQAQAVTGSFCDGRYNLAWGAGAAARKIAGTAQLWRRIGPDGQRTNSVQVVLVHAMVLAAVDVRAVTDIANQFESALGGGRRYDSAKIASLYDALDKPGYGREAFTRDLMASLARHVAASEPPGYTTLQSIHGSTASLGVPRFARLRKSL